MREHLGLDEASTGIRREFEKAALGELVKHQGGEVAREGWSGLATILERYLDREKIETNFLQQDSEDFVAMRQSLQTEPGLFVANHPAGYIDVPITLSMIQRGDTLIYVQSRVRDALVTAFAENFGDSVAQEVDRHLLTNAKADALGNFKRAINHMESGGLLVLYPTGGKEAKTEKPVFEPGFRLFLHKLAPDTMVYAVNYHLSGSPGASSSVKFAERAVSLEIPVLSKGEMGNPITAKVDERLTRVGEWSAAAESDEQLTEHYWELFSRPQ